MINTGDEVIISKQGLLSTVAWKIKDEVKYALEGSIFVSGSLIQWLRDDMKFFVSASESEELAKVAAGQAVGIVQWAEQALEFGSGVFGP